MGRDQDKVGEMVIGTVWLLENFIPLPSHWHGDEGRIIPGRQPTFVCMEGAYPSLPFCSLDPPQLKLTSARAAFHWEVEQGSRS